MLSIFLSCKIIYFQITSLERFQYLTMFIKHKTSEGTPSNTHYFAKYTHTHCPCNTDTAPKTMPALSLVILKFLLTYPFEFTIETSEAGPVTRPQRLCICSFLHLNNRKQDLGIGIFLSILWGV